jgi:hypothetical protein
MENKKNDTSDRELREIIPFKRIVYEQVDGLRFTVTIAFEARGPKTLLSWHALFETAGQFNQMRKTFKGDEGLTQTMEKLATYLEGMGRVKPN